MLNRHIITVMVFFLIGIVSAQVTSGEFISAPILELVCGIYNAFRTIGVTIGGLVFLYSGIKYLTEADDPAARKQSRDIMKIMVVGVGIILLADITILTVGGAALVKRCVYWYPS